MKLCATPAAGWLGDRTRRIWGPGPSFADVTEYDATPLASVLDVLDGETPAPGLVGAGDRHVGHVGRAHGARAVGDGAELAARVGLDAHGVGDAWGHSGGEGERTVGVDAQVVAAVVLEHGRARETRDRPPTVRCRCAVAPTPTQLSARAVP